MCSIYFSVFIYENMSVVKAHGSKVLVKHKGVIFDPNHKVEDRSFYNEVTIQAQPAISTATLPFSAGSQYNFDISAVNQLHQITDVDLFLDIFEFGNAAEVQLCPSSYLVNYVEWLNGRGEVLYREHNDVSWWSSLALIPDGLRTAEFHRSINTSERCYEGQIHVRNTTRRYRLPFVMHPWNIQKPYLGNLKDGLSIRIYWAASVVASGSGTPRITGAYLNLRQRRLPDADVKVYRERFNDTVMHKFLQADKLEFLSQTITAGTNFKLDLSSFKGDCPFMLFAIRSNSTSATSNAILKTLGLGEGASCDVLDPSGSSVLGSGTAVRVKLLEDRVSQHVPGTDIMKYRRWYVIPFCESVYKAAQGVDCGSFNFNGGKYMLSITPAAAGTSCVQTINLAAGSCTQGVYQLEYKGEVTDPLAYNASASTIKSTLEALQAFQEHPAGPLTVTASGALSSDATLTFASNMPPPNAHDDSSYQVKLVNTNMATTTTTISFDSAATENTTAGVAGWTTGTYDVTCYMFRKRQLQERAGELRAFDL